MPKLRVHVEGCRLGMDVQNYQFADATWRTCPIAFQKTKQEREVFV